MAFYYTPQPSRIGIILSCDIISRVSYAYLSIMVFLIFRDIRTFQQRARILK